MNSGDSTPTVSLGDWLARLRAELGDEPTRARSARAPRAALLDLARVAAHTSERIVAPLTTFLAGVVLDSTSRLLHVQASSPEGGATSVAGERKGAAFKRSITNLRFSCRHEKECLFAHRRPKRPRNPAVASTEVTPSYTRLDRRAADVHVVQRATASILDLTESLDRAMREEPRPDERLQMLRETTKPDHTGANDAIQAYRRARAAELKMPGGDRKRAQQMQLLLDGGHADILRVLEVTNRRYSWGRSLAFRRRQNGSGQTRGR